jgi:hypothetical protein
MTRSSYSLLHPRLATPMNSLFLSGMCAQQLALFYDLAAAGATIFSTKRLRQIYSGEACCACVLSVCAAAVPTQWGGCGRVLPPVGLWSPRLLSVGHGRRVPRWAAAVGIWLGLVLGGALGPALLSGSPAVTFSPAKPAVGVTLMLGSFVLVAGIGWQYLHVRLFVATTTGMAGLFGGLVLATQWESRIGMGVGMAVMVACCATGLGKARKLCCDCGSNGHPADEDEL